MSSRSADVIIGMVLIWEIEVLFILWMSLLFALTIDFFKYIELSAASVCPGDLSYWRKRKEAMVCVTKPASFSKIHYNHFASEQHI